jgi:multicomponent Na+:H+ antiporter subunit D
LVRAFYSVGDKAWDWIATSLSSGAKRLNERLHRHHGPEGVLGRSWPTGTMAFWTTVMLAIYLILTNL